MDLNIYTKKISKYLEEKYTRESKDKEIRV